MRKSRTFDKVKSLLKRTWGILEGEYMFKQKKEKKNEGCYVIKYLYWSLAVANGRLEQQDLLLIAQWVPLEVKHEAYVPIL